MNNPLIYGMMVVFWVILMLVIFWIELKNAVRKVWKCARCGEPIEGEYIKGRCGHRYGKCCAGYELGVKHGA